MLKNNYDNEELNQKGNDIDGEYCEFQIDGCAYLNVRERPTTKSNGVVIDSFDKIVVLQDLDEWSKVKVVTRDDLIGYVMNKFLKEV